MKTAKQAQRQARALFRLCYVGGAVDDERARGVVQRLVDAARPGSLAVLSRFHRLVRLEHATRRAVVISAAALPSEVREQLAVGVTRLYGPEVVISFAQDAALLGGVRITVGSDVYDGTVKAGLDALEARF